MDKPINSIQNLEELAKEIVSTVFKGDLYGLSDEEIVEIVARDLKKAWKVK